MFSIDKMEKYDIVYTIRLILSIMADKQQKQQNNDQNNDRQVWVVRGDNNKDKKDKEGKKFEKKDGHKKDKEYEEISLRKNFALIGWEETEDLKGKNEQEIKEKPTGCSQVVNFVCNIKPGHIIVFPLKTQPGHIAVGEVVGGYEFCEIEKGKNRHIRKVKKWNIIPKIDINRIHKIDKQSALHSRSCMNIGHDILNSLSGQRTVFEIDCHRYKLVERFEEMMDMNIKTDPELNKKHPRERERDIEIKFSPTQFEELVARVLEEEECTTCLTPRSGDSGVDVIAMKDKKPIFVQVKMKNGTVGDDDLHKLQEVMESLPVYDGIFVSWGGFDKKIIQKAKDEDGSKVISWNKDKCKFRIELWDKCEFMKHFDKHYHDLPKEIRDKVPPPQK